MDEAAIRFSLIELLDTIHFLKNDVNKKQILLHKKFDISQIRDWETLERKWYCPYAVGL